MLRTQIKNKHIHPEQNLDVLLKMKKHVLAPKNSNSSILPTWLVFACMFKCRGKFRHMIKLQFRTIYISFVIIRCAQAQPLNST